MPSKGAPKAKAAAKPRAKSKAKSKVEEPVVEPPAPVEAVPVTVERVLCCNVLATEQSAVPELFRSPIYAYDEELTWPPPAWQEGRCYYCAHGFDRPMEGGRKLVPPVPLPVMHDALTHEWRVSGLYCSWSCAKAELLGLQGFACGGGALLLDRLARTVFGYTGADIVPAPPRQRLRFFYPAPDSLDIDEFRAESANSFTTVVSPPLLSAPEVYERHGVPKAASWSVRGIRVSNAAEPLAAVASTSTSPSIFDLFVQQRAPAVAKPPVAAPAASAGGTLLDWKVTSE